MAGVILLLVSLDSVHAALRPTTGIVAWLGLMTLTIALILQTCTLTWQLFLDPVIAAQPAAQFLFTEGVFLADGGITVFRLTAAATIVVGVALFGTAWYRSGFVPTSAVVLVALGALAYSTGFMVSMYLSLGGVVALGIGCALIGCALSRTTD